MTAIPLIPTLALALLSFVSSIFIILRVVIPILPPHPLSRRVSPKEFGLPNFKTLSTLDKSHIWLATCDVISVVFLVSQVLMEYAEGPTNFVTASMNPGYAAQFWIALTFRQTSFLIMAGIVILHVRMGLSVKFGARHWMLWAPLLLYIFTSISITAVLAAIGVPSLFVGIAAYSIAVALLSTGAFAWLVATLKMIHRNLGEGKAPDDGWPGIPEKQRRRSFALEDIDDLKDRESWITSVASTHARTMSAFSFSTVHSAHPSVYSEHYQGHESPAPPVPPLPSPYRTTFPTNATAIPQLRSQDSWLTEDSHPRTVLSAWSFPASRPGTPGGFIDASSSTNLAEVNPDISSAEVLGGYGQSPAPAGLSNAEKGVRFAHPDEAIQVSWVHIAFWLPLIWLPLAFSMPYLFNHDSMVAAVFVTISVTISSPLLACNILLRSPLPIGAEIFSAHTGIRSRALASGSAAESQYKRSGSSHTVVEGRRSGDVWIANGDAVDHKNKIARALGLLPTAPKLAVLPTKELEEDKSFVSGPDEFSYLASLATRQTDMERQVAGMNEFGIPTVSSKNTGRTSLDGYTTATSTNHTRRSHLRSRSTPSVNPSVNSEFFQQYDSSNSPVTSQEDSEDVQNDSHGRNGSGKGHKHYSSLPTFEDGRTAGAERVTHAAESRPSLHLNAVMEEDESQLANSPQQPVFAFHHIVTPPSARSSVVMDMMESPDAESTPYYAAQQLPYDTGAFNPSSNGQNRRTSNDRKAKSNRQSVDSQDSAHSRGLRPLRLLQDNKNATSYEESDSKTKSVFRTLSFGKKRHHAREDENSPRHNTGHVESKRESRTPLKKMRLLHSSGRATNA